MAKVKRYSSFEEMENAAYSEKKKKPAKSSSNQKIFKEFGELLRKGMLPNLPKKK